MASALLERLTNLINSFASRFSPLAIALILLCAGVLVALLGFVVELGAVAGSLRESLGGLLRDMGLAILVGGVVGAIFRVVAMLNLHEEMFAAFILDPKTLARRNDLREMWLKLTRIQYLQGREPPGEGFVEEIGEALESSVMAGKSVVLEGVDRDLKVDWARDLDGKPVDGRRAVVRENLKMRVIPVGVDGTGEFSTEYTLTVGGSFEGYRIEVKSFCEGNWDGKALPYTLEPGETLTLLKAPIASIKDVFLIREYEWDICDDPHMMIAWAYLTRGYKLSVECAARDIRLFFLTEKEFEEDMPEAERRAQPWRMKKVCKGVLLPGQSHTIAFLKV